MKKITNALLLLPILLGGCGGKTASSSASSSKSYPVNLTNVSVINHLPCSLITNSVTAYFSLKLASFYIDYNTGVQSEVFYTKCNFTALCDTYETTALYIDFKIFDARDTTTVIFGSRVAAIDKVVYRRGESFDVRFPICKINVFYFDYSKSYAVLISNLKC